MSILLTWAGWSCVVIFAVLVLRSVLEEHISLRVRYALWLVVAARLLIPAQLPVHLPVTAPEVSLPNVVQRPVSPELAEGYAHIPANRLGENAIHVDQDGNLTSDEPSWYLVVEEDTGDVRAYFGGTTVGDVIRYSLIGIWIAGGVVTAAVIIVSNVRFARKLRRVRLPMDVEDCPLQVYVAGDLSTPCLAGLLHPSIYLTPDTAGESERRDFVLAHELTHYTHWDQFWSVIRCFCLVLHWYNPLVWVAANLSKKDGELACDEGAIGRLGEEDRLAYGRTLVDLVALRNPGAKDLFTCSTAMAGGKGAIQQRIELLVEKPTTKKAALVAVVLLLAGCLAVAFAGCAEKEAPIYPEGQHLIADRIELKQILDSEEVSMINFSGGVLSSFLGPPIEDEDLLAQAKKILLSDDPQKGTAKPMTLYYDASISIHKKDGSGLGVMYITNVQMSRDLEAVAREQYERVVALTPDSHWVASETMAKAVEMVGYDPTVDYMFDFTRCYLNGDIDQYLVQMTRDEAPREGPERINKIYGVWSVPDRDFVGKVYDLPGNDGHDITWPEHKGEYKQVSAHIVFSTNVILNEDGSLRGTAPLYLRWAGEEIEPITTLPEIARAAGGSALPSDEVFFDPASDFWQTHLIIPDDGAYGFCLYELTPGTMREVCYIPLREPPRNYKHTVSYNTKIYPERYVKT